MHIQKWRYNPNTTDLVAENDGEVVETYSVGRVSTCAAQAVIDCHTRRTGERYERGGRDGVVVWVRV